MPGNTKPLVLDVNAKPAPQVFNPAADAYEYLFGRNGAMRVELYGPTGQPILVSNDKLAVRATELESILGEVSATPTANTLADRLKAIADRLGEVSANPTANTALARLKALEGYLDGLEGYLDGLEAALGTQADAEATGNGSIIAILKRLRTILSDVWDDAANALSIKLTGSNVEQAPGQAPPGKGLLVGGSDGALFRALRTDAQGAIDTTASQREAVARVIDAIIAEIGLDNIACFLPMWEQGGSELRDLIHPSLKFRVSGATPGVVGPLGNAWGFDGVNDYVEEAPAIETAAGSSDAMLDAADKMLAQRIKQKQPLRPVAFVQLSLKKVGNPAGTLVVEIREDNGGIPGSTVVATSATLAVVHLTTTYRFYGFPFDPPIFLQPNKTYWLVLKLQTATTVDAGNYIAWSYDAVGAYGEPRATYDGATWGTATGQSHGFKVYYDFLAVKDVTYIVAAKPLATTGRNTLISHLASTTTTAAGLYARVLRILDLDVDSNVWEVGDGSLSLLARFARDINLDRYAACAMTISTAAATDKIVAYWNGQKVASVSGTAGQSSGAPRGPLVIGALGNIGNTTLYYVGHIGAVIVARTPLSQTQIANVTRHLLTLRRYGVQGV